jgi:hypothetical protein
VWPCSINSLKLSSVKWEKWCKDSVRPRFLWLRSFFIQWKLLKYYEEMVLYIRWKAHYRSMHLMSAKIPVNSKYRYLIVLMKHFGKNLQNSNCIHTFRSLKVSLPNTWLLPRLELFLHLLEDRGPMHCLFNSIHPVSSLAWGYVQGLFCLMCVIWQHLELQKIH